MRHATSSRRTLLMTTIGLFYIGWQTPSVNAETPQTTNAAMEQCKRLGRGVNILGYDAIWKSASNARFQAEHFAKIHEAGFQHVRINLHPFRDGNPDGSLAPQYWKTLDWAVAQSLNNHLAVILDFHEFLEMGRDPAGRKELFLSLWKQLAERYQDAPATVYFELLNEPHGKLTPAMWNQFLRESLAVVRTTNPQRTVIVGPGHWNSIDFLDDLKLPSDDRNLIVTVHYYNPFAFTHQGTPWTNQKDKTGVVWEGTDQEREEIVRDLQRAQGWAKSHGRPVYLGEFGAYDKADMPSRARYLDFVARQAEKRGWSWAYWQFDSDFILYDIPNRHWVKPLVDALAPRANR